MILIYEANAGTTTNNARGSVPKDMGCELHSVAISPSISIVTRKLFWNYHDGWLLLVLYTLIMYTAYQHISCLHGGRVLSQKLIVAKLIIKFLVFCGA
jgi:hypothetical protein